MDAQDTMSAVPPLAAELPRLLLVEDSETSAALISRFLRGRYEVRHVRSGDEAWKTLLTDRKIELVVTDIQMPGMTGHQLLVKIRTCNVAELKSLPVIVMTTTDDNRDRNLAFENGANDFVTKPVDPIELQARVAIHQKLARTIRELEASQKLLQEQAATDPLTKLRNRRAFFEDGKRHFAHSRRRGNDLSLAIFDLDHFKKINDTYGHQAGDEALLAMAQILIKNTRTEDTPARIGGEEFAILLPDTNRLGAAVLAERIRGAIEHNRFSFEGFSLSLTASAGIASFGVDGQDSLEHLISVADKRLYLAKTNGRNRVVVDDEGKSI
jgi:two-component system cell cycle response regulator